MAKGYWVGHSDIVDFEKMQRYRESNQKVLARYGAKFIVAGGRQEIREGKSRSRQMIIEFETYQAALAAYDDPEYQQAAGLRRSAAESDLVIVEGFNPA